MEPAKFVVVDIWLSHLWVPPSDPGANCYLPGAGAIQGVLHLSMASNLGFHIKDRMGMMALTPSMFNLFESVLGGSL